MNGKQEVVIVAGCLAGWPCRYHGIAVPPRKKLIERLIAKYGKENVLFVCAEKEGGLPVPRPPAYRKNGRLFANGKDVTVEFAKGAMVVYNLAKEKGAVKYYGLRNSPSCDPVKGVTCKLLSQIGVKCHYG